MKTILVTVFTISILLLSCKKENSANPTANSPTIPNNSVTVEGIFTAYHNVNGIYNWSANAKFWESTNSSIFIDSDSVSINSNWLGNYSGTFIFIKHQEWLASSTPINFFSNINWKTTGSAKVPAINHTNSNFMPYMDVSYLTTTTVSKVVGVTISHPNINSTKTEYKIFEPTSSGGSLFLLKTVIGNSTGVTFTPSELSAIPTGSNGAIRIVAYSDELVSPQAAVNFTFSNQCELQNYINITN